MPVSHYRPGLYGYIQVNYKWWWCVINSVLIVHNNIKQNCKLFYHLTCINIYLHVDNYLLSGPDINDYLVSEENRFYVLLMLYNRMQISITIWNKPISSRPIPKRTNSWKVYFVQIKFIFAEAILLIHGHTIHKVPY